MGGLEEERVLKRAGWGNLNITKAQIYGLHLSLAGEIYAEWGKKMEGKRKGRGRKDWEEEIKRGGGTV